MSSALIKVLVIVGIVAVILASYYFYGEKQKTIGEKLKTAEVVVSTQENNTVIRTRKKVIKHETQNLDRDAIIAEHCANGWVRVGKDKCPN